MKRLFLSLLAALTVMLCSAQAKYTDFKLKDVSGKEHSFKEYVKKGKKNYVLIDFWASWCGPCCREMPNIKEAYDKYHKKGFQIVGVSLDFKADAWKRAIEKYEMTWPQLSDLQGWKSTAASKYDVNSIPYTVLVDGDGKIVATGLRGAALQKKLKQIYGF